MKIGIVVHSHTGNTYSVAPRLKEELLKDGHSVNLEKVTAVNENQAEARDVRLESMRNRNYKLVKYKSQEKD